MVPIMAENKTLPLSCHNSNIIVGFNNKKRRQLDHVFMKHLHWTLKWEEIILLSVTSD